MRRKQFWTIAIGALILLTAAAGHAPAEAGSRAASQSAGEDAEDRVTFRVRIQNISADTDPPVLFAPGVWALHSEAGPIFTAGEADRGEGLEALAEDGDPRRLVKSLRAKGLQAGIFHTPVCADAPGLLPSGETVEFGNSYEDVRTAFGSSPTQLRPVQASMKSPSCRRESSSSQTIWEGAKTAQRWWTWACLT